jgi:hypothetical protein
MRNLVAGSGTDSCPDFGGDSHEYVGGHGAVALVELPDDSVYPTDRGCGRVLYRIKAAACGGSIGRLGLIASLPPGRILLAARGLLSRYL